MVLAGGKMPGVVIVGATCTVVGMGSDIVGATAADTVLAIVVVPGV